LIEFPSKKRISEIWLYLDYKTDESYTPSKISIRIENSFNEMIEIKTVDYDEPVGWYQITLEEKNSESEIYKPYVITSTVQIMILQNNHNGRDTIFGGQKFLLLVKINRLIPLFLNLSIVNKPNFQELDNN